MPTLAEILGREPQGIAQSQNPALQALIAAALKKRQMMMQPQLPMAPAYAPMIGVRG